MDDIKLLVGKQIRHLRKERGLSQEELGARANLHFTYVGAVERGEKNLSITSLGKIATGLDITISEIFSFQTKQPDVQRIRDSLASVVDGCSPELLLILSDLIKYLEKQTNQCKSK